MQKEVGGKDLEEPAGSIFELPAGTMVKVGGIPYELQKPTLVKGHKLFLSHVDPFSTKPVQAASPESLATSNSSPESI